MAVTVTGYEDQGDGRVRVLGRTTAGAEVSVVIGRDLLGSADMYRMLDRQGEQHDTIMVAQAARDGRSERDPT